MRSSSSIEPTITYPEQAVTRRRGGGCLIAAIIAVLVFIGILLMLVVFFALFKGSITPKPAAVKPNTIIQLRVNGRLEERTSANPLSIFGAEKSGDISFFEALSALQRAKEDPNIIGLYYRAGELRGGMAKIAELRQAMIDFKKTGKFIIAFIEMGSEWDYLFASVADTIYMPMEGFLELNGFAIQDIFWPDTFAKIGLTFHVDQFEEYKSAGEPYSRKNFSPYARESLRTWLCYHYETLLTAIAESRKLDKQTVRAAFHRGVYTADSLLSMGLIDHIRCESSVKDMLLKNMSSSADSVRTQDKKNHLMTLSQYSKSSASSEIKKHKVIKDKQIALITATGIIIPGEEENTPLLSEEVIASQTFIRYLRQAREDKRIKAVILRIDSPGGSVMAADAIWEEILKTKRVKPIYASMSDVAASGGYYIAMGCDTIIAHPQTTTGSIGVISTIPNISGTLAKIDAHVDTIATSPSALFFDPYLPFTEKDKRTLRRYGAAAYERFVRRVAESRQMSFSNARAVARGRIWTGEAAFRHGLVDTLGGLQTALNIAKRRIGVAPDQKVRLRFFPPPQDPIDVFLKLFERLSEENTGQINLSARNLTAVVPIWDMWPPSMKRQALYLYRLGLLNRHERILVAMPFLPEIE